MATPHNPLTLKSEQKQKVLHTIIDKEIDKEKYLQSIYLQDIQMLKNKKQMLESLLESRQSLVRNGSRLEDSWKYYQDERYKSKMNGSLLAESNLDQSRYQPNSPIKLNSIQKRQSNESPIRKLNNSSKILTKNSLIDLKPSQPTHYNKIEQLQNQLSLIESRLSQQQQSQHKISSSNSIKLNEKQKQKQKQKEDEISTNLWLKIKQQEDVKSKEFQRQRLLQIKKMYAKQIKDKIDKVKEEIFKNSKTLNIVQRDLVNRNKDIIKGGYTRKMLELIQSYAGSRKD